MFYVNYISKNLQSQKVFDLCLFYFISSPEVAVWKNLPHFIFRRVDLILARFMKGIETRRVTDSFSIDRGYQETTFYP